MMLSNDLNLILISIFPATKSIQLKIDIPTCLQHISHRLDITEQIFS